MNQKALAFIAGTALMTAAVDQLHAATLSLTSGTPGNYGDANGAVVNFSSATPSTAWDASPTNGTTYSLDSITFYRAAAAPNAEITAATTIWVNVYQLTYTGGAATLNASNYLGSSTNSFTGQQWIDAAGGAAFTWNFDFNATAGENQALFFVYRGSADATGTVLRLPSQRMPDAAGDYAAAGAGTWATFGATNRVARFTLVTEAIPEPTAMGLAGLSMLSVMLRRRRR